VTFESPLAALDAASSWDSRVCKQVQGVTGHPRLSDSAGAKPFAILIQIYISKEQVRNLEFSFGTVLIYTIELHIISYQRMPTDRAERAVPTGIGPAEKRYGILYEY
jgi:hypothetical protein